MNGKITGWLLRVCSFLLAALMVFGNLYLPSGFLKASAEEATDFLIDFENYAVGTSPYTTDQRWYVKEGTGNTDVSAATTKANVVEINGNKALYLRDTDNTGLKVGYLIDANGLTDATLSYNVAVEKKSGAFFPSLGNASDGEPITRFGFVGGNYMYYNVSSESGNKAVSAGNKNFNEPLLTWYTVKVAYSASGVKVYINGVESNVPAYTTLPSTIDSVAMMLNNWGKIYVDNIKLTVDDHTPSSEKLPEILEAVESPATYFTESFDSVELNSGVGSLPVYMENIPNGTPAERNWTPASAAAGMYTVVEAPVDANGVDHGNALLFNQGAEKPTSGGHSLYLRPEAVDGKYSKIVFEYDIYTNSTDTLRPFSLTGNSGQFLVQTVLSGGRFHYQDDSWHLLATLDANTWYNVKFVVDTVAKCWYFYLNDEFVARVDSFYSSNTNYNTFYGIQCTSYGGSYATGTYFDNFKLYQVSPATKMTVDKSVVDLEVNGTAQIQATVTPTGADVTEVTYKSNNEAVAKVDANGKITAVGAGSATITVSPVQKNLNYTKTVTVNVNKIIYRTGFETTDTEAFTVGDMGFDYTSAAASTKYSNWSLNCKADETCAAEIVKINGNQVLVLSNNCGSKTNENTDADLQVRRNNLGDLSDVWLSYNVAVDNTTGMLFFPTLCGKNGESVLFGINQNSWTWRESVDGQTKMNSVVYEDNTSPEIEAKTWYTVEIHYINGDTPKAEVYINGELTSIGPKYTTSMTVNRILINLDSWGNGETKGYVDNITVSTLRLPKIDEPASLIVESEKAETTYLETGFEANEATPYISGTSIDVKGESINGWVIKSWGAAITNEDQGLVSIKTINGNQVLSLKNLCEANGGSRYDRKIRVGYDLSGLGDDVWVTFNAAIMKAGTAAFFPAPVLTGGAEAAYYGINGSSFQYQDGLWDNALSATDPRYKQWDAITLAGTSSAPAKPAAQTWYAIKLHYVNAADGGYVELWINGQKMNNITYGTKSGVMSGLLMELNHWGSVGECELLIDNVKVTNFDHTPATPSAGLESPVILNTGFETADKYAAGDVLSEGTAYNGWNVDYATNGTGSAAIKEIENSDGTKNQVLAVSTKAREGSGNTDVIVYYNLPNALNYAVLTYNVARVSDAGVLFFPSVAKDGTYATRFGFMGGALQWWSNEIRSPETAAMEYANVMQDTTDTPANISHEAMQWHKVKVIYQRDTETGLFTTEVWVDGVKTSADNYHQQTPSTNQVNRILLTASKFGTGEMYIDNICLTTDGSNPELPILENIQIPDLDFQEDFEDWNLGDVSGFNTTGYGAVAGWSAANPKQIGTSIRVLDMNGNKVLALTRYDTLSEQHPIRYNILDRELKKATLTYNVAVSNHTMVAGFPSLTNRPDGTGTGAHRLVNIGTNNGKLMYAPAAGGWYDVYDEPTAIVPYTWYNVKQTYEIDANGVVTSELYINGVLTDVERAYNEVPNISSVLMLLNSNGTAGTMYIDNIHLTEGDLENEPVANDQLPALVDFFEDFESVAVTDGVGVWGNAPDGYRVVDDTATGKALEICYGSSDNVYTAAVMTFAAAQRQTVIEYTLSYENGSSQANLLTAAAAGAAPVGLVLNTATGEITAGGASLATIEEGKSYAIKLVVDADKAVMYVWVDGVYVGQVAAMSEDIASVSMQTAAGSACEGVYLDNITVKDFVPVQSFTATAEGVDNALVYKTYPIIVTMSPDYASVDAYSFEVVQGTDVVSVDAKGNITALKIGTATIKVTHPSVGDKTITVNVTGTYDPEPIMEETFENYQDGDNSAALMAGNAIGDYATVYDKNGNKVLQVSNPDKDNHGFAYIQYKDAQGNVKSFDGKVYMSYYLAVNNVEGHFYIPTPGNNSSRGAIISAHGDGLFKYSTNGNDWFVLRYTDETGGEAGYEKMKWYLIEFEFTGGANPDLKMKINGRPVEIKHNGLSTNNSIAMQMTKWMINGNKDAYIDNIRVTEIPHTPMDAPAANLNVAAINIVILDEQGNPIDTTVPYVIGAQTPIRLTAQTFPGGATDKTYTLSSDKVDVADIDTNGYLVGYESGTATITATLNSDKNISCSITVQVSVVPVETITIASEKTELYVGGHCFATATVAPANTSYSTIRWVSKNTDVVKVDSYGEIVAVGAGTAVVYAYSEHDNVYSNEITITVTDPEVAGTITVSNVTELRAALDYVAQINATDGMTGNIVIELEGGYYYLESTLEFGPEHSGTNGYSLVIRAKSGETPVIGGAYEVDGEWTVHDAQKNIYAVQVPEGVESRQLYVNDVRATRARSVGGLTGSNFLYDSDGVNIGYTCYNTEFLSFARPDDLELVFKEQWTQPRCGVAQIRAGSKPNSVELIMDQPGWSGGGGSGSSVTNKGGTSAQADGPVWFENAYELLDEPGEWYLDTVTNTLYYIPRVWEDMDEVKVTLPVFDNTVAEDGKYPISAGDGALVHISGTFNDEKKNDVNEQVQNIHFEGITFADTTWMRPSSTHGHSDAQNNHIRENGDTMAPGAVVVEAANAIWFNGCTFTRLGINGLQLQNGAQNSFIIGNHFYDISGNAITVGEPGTDLENAYAQGLNTVKNNDILNNYIHNIGVDFGSSAAISVGFAADMDMSHNEIFDTPYSGWHIGYGWNTRFKNNNKNMMIEYNFVHDIMDQDIYDGGAFYFLGNMSGEGYNEGYSFLRRNYIRKQMNAHGGIYPDQGTTYLKIVENVIDLSEVDSWFNGTAPKWSLTNQVCQHIHYEDNFTTTDYHSWSNQLDFEKDDITGIGENPTGITVVPDADWSEYEVAMDVVTNAGLQEGYKSLRNNQVERVTINVEDEVLLDKGETFTLQVTAADGRDNVISSGYQVYYASLDPAVATVSENGVIEGVATGIATIRVYVLSNGVLDQMDVSAVVSDVPESVAIKGISDGITMSMTSVKTLDTMVVTALGREIAPESVTFGVANESIAVAENGVLKPVTTGVTSLVVTATAEGVTLTEVFRVEIVEEMTYVTVDAGDMFDAENEMYWYQNGTKYWELTDDVSISSAVGNSSGAGFANYTGNCFENQLISFKLKIANPGGWPSIVLRAQDNSSYVSQGPDGYIFCMGKNGLELYRFVGGVRYVIYGGTNTGWVSVPGGSDALTPAESGFTYNSENYAEHDIQVGAITDGDYVRILLYVDGKKVIDFLDKEGAIVEPGYFGVVGKGETFTLSKISGITAPETPAAEVNGETYPTLHAAIAAAHASGQSQTVKVLENTVEDSIVLNGITLDLNGKELEVKYLIAFGSDVIDSTGGSAVLKTKNISLPKNNAQMPVWDKDADGYRMFSVVSHQGLLKQEEDSFEFYCKPALGDEANDIFLLQPDTNGLTIKIRMSWSTASESTVEQIFTFETEDVIDTYSDPSVLLYLKVTGAARYVNNLRVSAYIVSDTGVEWIPEPGELFVGK